MWPIMLSSSLNSPLFYGLFGSSEKLLIFNDKGISPCRAGSQINKFFSNWSKTESSDLDLFSPSLLSKSKTHKVRRSGDKKNLVPSPC